MERRYVASGCASILLLAALAGGCRGTKRCEPGFVFGEDGECVSVDTCDGMRDVETGECLASRDGGGIRDAGRPDPGIDGGSADGGTAEDGGADGGSSCEPACGECETCVDAACEPLTDETACTDGLCYDGACCTGCWDGSACQPGTERTACGAAGAACVECGCESDTCTDGACEPLGGGVRQFDVSQHVCAVLADDRLFCFGRNDRGQLGLGDESARVSPIEVLTGTRWNQVDTGDLHTCARSDTNELFCWGANQFGQLGLGDEMDRDVPSRVTIASTVHIAAGAHTGATTDSLYAWGDDVDLSPALVAGSSPSPWHLVDACNEQRVLFAIRRDGTLWSVGYSSADAEPVGAATNWVQVDAGTFNACAINADGELFCYGDNTGGILGFGDSSSRGTLSRHDPFSDWVDVSLAQEWICAVRAGGQLYCGGAFASPRELSTSRVGADTDWSHVRVGQGVLYATKSDRTLWEIAGDPDTTSPTRVCF